jgi:hypothetical protein
MEQSKEDKTFIAIAWSWPHYPIIFLAISLFSHYASDWVMPILLAWGGGGPIMRQQKGWYP